LTQTELNLTTVLGMILRGEKLDFSILPSGTSLEEILKCAKKNSVLHLLYNTIVSNADECFDDSEFIMYEISSAKKEANQSFAWSEFEICAEENGVDILMLKGIYLKNFYPNPELREMCDIDILYKPEQAKKLEKVFVSLGYKKCKSTTCHDGWFNSENGVTFEAHHILNSEEENSLCFYGDLRKRAVAVEGKKHIFHMTNEDMYIHLLLHMRSHLRTGSASLRQLADLYIMKINNTNYNEKTDGYLKELGLERFADSLEQLIVLLFENNSALIKNSELSALADFIFGNLTFGQFSNIQAQAAYRSGGSKLRAVLLQIFPKPEKIYKSYPFFARYRYLLPFGYIYRLMQSFGIRKNNKKKKLTVLNGVTADAALQGEKIAEFLDKYGI